MEAAGQRLHGKILLIKILEVSVQRKKMERFSSRTSTAILSVCLSVTLWYCIIMASHVISHSSFLSTEHLCEILTGPPLGAGGVYKICNFSVKSSA